MPLSLAQSPLPSPQPASTLRPGDLPRLAVPGLYVHIPFCFHKCHYCDFYSITRQTPQRMQSFVDLLLKEADQWCSGSGPLVTPRTIFFGGGTPSLLPIGEMERLIRGLGERFDFSGVVEWTIEVNPATASLDYCQMLRRLGVNRLSFGAQSFDRAELQILERHHDPDDVPRSLELARSAGFERLNLDLIYAIPGQTLSHWMRSLESALRLGTTHLSCYGLTYEPNTPMAVKKRLGRIEAVEEGIELQMLHATRDRLGQAGLSAYEISNYAVPGQECQHNLLYWRGEDYIGLGPSAASHARGRRWRNRPHLGEWESALAAGFLPATDLEQLSPAQRAGELVMLQLRLAAGVRFAEFVARTGVDARAVYSDCLRRLSALSLLQVDEIGFRLTAAGINVADALAAEFLAPSENPSH